MPLTVSLQLEQTARMRKSSRLVSKPKTFFCMTGVGIALIPVWEESHWKGIAYGKLLKPI